MKQQPIVAFLYDFDKTLCTTDMQDYAFIPSLGMTPAEFWAEANGFGQRNRMDGILAYMYTMLREAARRNRPFTRADLVEKGRSIVLFPGVEDWFRRINAFGAGQGVQVEHYIISSGLTDIIKGSAIGDRFKAVFAASFCYDAAGRAVWPSTAVNYTNKTQYLFRINKGILDVTNKRRVPFSNMIYVGDGLTDVPCMKMTKQKGGYSIAVHAPGQTETADDMLLQGRVDFALEADYSAGSEMERIVTMLMRRILATHELSAVHASQLRAAHERRGKQTPLNVSLRGGLVEEIPE